ncbi:twitching motility protein PilT [Acidobacteria bacterium Mor1]|nr:twitching motility protein PilT [Acidobacteria bacterium Mor1]
MLDSVILIDHFNGIQAATDYLRDVAGQARISAITRAEVMTGFKPADADAPRQLLDSFLTIPIDAAVADLAAELRRSGRLRLPDALQAAAAVHHGLKLATRNEKDFSKRRFNFVVVPYRL